MPVDLLNRLGWAAGIIILGWILFQLANRVVLRRAGGHSHPAGLFQPGKPALLYFTTPDCAPCKTTQRPAIQRLQERLGNRLQVVEVNAYEQPDLARDWGVLSVPTTFIIDAQGRPRHVNHGVTLTEKLLEQVQAVE